MKQQREMLAGVKRGDRVVTGGGIIGLVTKVIGDNELQVELAEGVRVRVLKTTITDIITRGESVRGGKESDDDAKPMLPPPAAAPERKSLLGSLFGRK
jgi:preprotein translocase subunit YajC